MNISKKSIQLLSVEKINLCGSVNVENKALKILTRSVWINMNITLIPNYLVRRSMNPNDIYAGSRKIIKEIKENQVKLEKKLRLRFER